MDLITLLKTLVGVITLIVIAVILKKAITDAVKKEISDALDVLEQLLREYKNAVAENSDGGKKITPEERDRVVALFISFLNELYDVIKVIRNSEKIK